MRTTFEWPCAAELLSCTVVEMALRKRLPSLLNAVDTRTLSNLLEQANKQKLINEKGFSHRRNLRKNKADRLRVDRQIMPGIRRQLPKRSYAKDLSEQVKTLRNLFAHPRTHSITMPHDALFQLRLTADLVNQLWP
jgi:hypothetical protein